MQRLNTANFTLGTTEQTSRFTSSHSHHSPKNVIKQFRINLAMIEGTILSTMAYYQSLLALTLAPSSPSATRQQHDLFIVWVRSVILLLKTLHWLAIVHKINFKLIIYVLKVLLDLAPAFTPLPLLSFLTTSCSSHTRLLCIATAEPTLCPPQILCI